MFNEPRNWKWMVPAGFTVLFLMIYGQAVNWGDFEWLGDIFLGLAIICGVAGLMNFGLYIYVHAGAMIADVNQAMNSTPEVRMFEAAKGLHPDAVKLLLVQRRTIWRLRFVPESELADWVLDEAPSVHVGFVLFLLKYSTDDALMPISMLSEGSYQFDPDKLVPDRQQYEDTTLLFRQHLYCTQAFGNQPPKWLKPWTPDTLRTKLGLSNWNFDEEEWATVPMNAAEERAVAWKNGKSGKSDPIDAALEDLEQTTWMKQQMERR